MWWLTITWTIALIYPILTTGFQPISSSQYTIRWNSQVACRGKARDDVDSIVSSLGLAQVEKGKKKKQSQTKTKKKPSSTLLSEESKSMVGSKVGLRTQLDYSRNGHAVLRDHIDPKLLKDVRTAVMGHAQMEEIKSWRQKVQVALDSPEIAASCKTIEDCQEQLESLGIVDIPFLQYFNTWRTLPVVKELAYALAESASILLDVPKVRLYQDSIFWKRSVDGPTPWHVDSKMAPFDTSHFVTFWIPLTPVPSSGTGLMFCSKSHADFALPYWNPVSVSGKESSEWDRLEHRYPEKIIDYMPMKVGDLTVHSGWTLHCAGASDQTSDRIALAISFVDANAEIRPDALDTTGKGDNEDLNGYLEWATSVKPRSKFEHPMVPIVWPRSWSV
ncbi:unnamed protein product [Cylindrotheca closterium]|uniref:Phytanoyl-CoA dioxygenase n=1 Tax=Cylindrotheca closterium TaxID=2856 RepID=A0AAD2CR65_9STRA|nr:unnamed protein product [Cylindrotheca closterium]